MRLLIYESIASSYMEQVLARKEGKERYFLDGDGRDLDGNLHLFPADLEKLRKKAFVYSAGCVVARYAVGNKANNPNAWFLFKLVPSDSDDYRYLGRQFEVVYNRGFVPLQR